jgi:hypothetical protein
MFEPLSLTADLHEGASAAGFYQTQALIKIMVRQLVPLIKPKLDARQPSPCTTSCHPLSVSM